jgi:phage portal protein BeeE
VGILDVLLGPTAPAPVAPPAEELARRAEPADDATLAALIARSSAQLAPYQLVGVGAVWACVRVIADAVSVGPWTEWRGLEQLEPSRLVQSPTRRYTRHEWSWRVAATLALYNVCAVQLVGGSDSEGVPWSVVPLAPGSWQREGEGWRVNGEKVAPDLVRVIRRASLPGLNDQAQELVRLARADFEAAWAAADYVASYWAEGGRPPVTLLRTDQDLTESQAQTIRERWIAERLKGPHNPAVLARGADARPFGADASGSEAVEARRELVADVARWFGVPPHLVNAPAASGALTYVNTEAAGVAFVSYTLLAYTTPMADLISSLLPGGYMTGRRVQIDLRHLTRPEQEARFRAYESALRAGWMTVDEVRLAEGMAPLGGSAAELPAPSSPATQEGPA